MKSKNTQSVSIKKATVKIRILEVDNKQMTVAVYKQIQSINVYVDFLKTIDQYTIWGLVNHHTIACKDAQLRHIHFLCEKEGNLFVLVVNETAIYGCPERYYPQLFIAV